MTRSFRVRTRSGRIIVLVPEHAVRPVDGRENAWRRSALLEEPFGRSALRRARDDDWFGPIGSARTYVVDLGPIGPTPISRPFGVFPGDEPVDWDNIPFLSELIDRGPTTPTTPRLPGTTSPSADSGEQGEVTAPLHSLSLELLHHTGVPFAGAELTLVHCDGRRDSVVLDEAGRHTARALVPPGPTQVLLPPQLDRPAPPRVALAMDGFTRSPSDITVPRRPTAPVVLQALDTHYRLVIAPPRCSVLSLDGWSEGSPVLVFGTLRVTPEGPHTVRCALHTILSHSGEGVLHVIGHADTEGKASDNAALALERARSTCLYLQGARDAWAEHAFAHADVATLQRALAWAAAAADLNCAPGPIDGDWGPTTASALAALRTHAGVDQNQPLGPRDWSAIYDLYDDDLARLVGGRQTLADLRARLVVEPATVGERWPVEAPQTDGHSCAANRRVELIRCIDGDEPEASPDGVDALYDGTYLREPIEVIPEGPNADLAPDPPLVLCDRHLRLPNLCVLVDLPERPQGAVQVVLGGTPATPRDIAVQGRRVYFEVPPLHADTTGEVRYGAHGAAVIRRFRLAACDTIEAAMASIDRQFENLAALVDTGSAAAQDPDHAELLRDSARQRQISVLCSIETAELAPADYAKFAVFSWNVALIGRRQE
jgi:hypothetical protein